MASKTLSERKFKTFAKSDDYQDRDMSGKVKFGEDFKVPGLAS